jgi:molybdenum cofactor cytidylyltransferase
MAAGESKRFGSPKQLHLINGQPLIRHTVERVIDCAIDDVFVVLGHAADAVSAVLTDLPVRFVRNPDPSAGLGSSIAFGASAVDAASPPFDAVIIVLGDQPTIPRHIIDALCASFRAQPADVIVLEYTGGVRAPPALFSRNVFAEMRSLSGETGARELMAQRMVRVLQAGITVPVDIDSLADVEALRAQRRRPGTGDRGQGEKPGPRTEQ